MLLAPAVAKLEPQLLRELSQAEPILFDGTFWSHDDFARSGVPTDLLASFSKAICRF